MSATTGDASQYLTFQVGGQALAVGILRVREIIEHEPVTRVPGTPPAIVGVINLRGIVVPVVDLAVRFGGAERPVTRRTCIVILEVALDEEQVIMGVIADSVEEVIGLAPGDVVPPPAFGTGVRVEYLRGMGRIGRRFVLILDIDRVLSGRELGAAAALGEAAGALEPPAAADSPPAPREDTP